MKSSVKIILRYILSAGGIALLLLIANLLFLSSFVISNSNFSKKMTVSQISDSLIKEDNSYLLDTDASAYLENNTEWAMLLNDDGNVIWSFNMPSDIPLKYTASDIAAFTKWYLNDYPVDVWSNDNGLFVLAHNKNTVWKLTLSEPLSLMNNIIKWIATLLIINFLIAVLLAFLFGLNTFRSIEKIINGIHDIAQKKPVFLQAKGVFKDLADNINNTSTELIRQQNLINKKDTARNNWIAGVSHDIRTPLSMIMGYSSSLEANERFATEDRHIFSIIRLQSEKIKQLINDLNLTVKLEYEMQPLRITPIYISELLRKITVDYLNTMYDDKYSLELSIDDTMQDYMINGDYNLLQRAFNNIIGNSMKHNSQGCSIKIEVSPHNDDCIIKINDNGTGFNTQTLDKLNSSNEMPTGTSHGLGLFIVKQIIAVHGGTVSFDNCETGSQITIVLNTFNH